MARTKASSVQSKSWLLNPDVRRADEFPAAKKPAVAARPAPNNSSQKADRIALLAGKEDLGFAQPQLKAVHQTDSSFRNVSAKGGEFTPAVNAQADWPKESVPAAGSAVALCGFLRLDNHTVNGLAKPSVPLRNVLHSVQAFSRSDTAPGGAFSSRKQWNECSDAADHDNGCEPDRNLDWRRGVLRHEKAAQSFGEAHENYSVQSS
jgi:hypothetical protein